MVGARDNGSGGGGHEHGWAEERGGAGIPGGESAHHPRGVCRSTHGRAVRALQCAAAAMHASPSGPPPLCGPPDHTPHELDERCDAPRQPCMQRPDVRQSRAAGTTFVWCTLRATRNWDVALLYAAAAGRAFRAPGGVCTLAAFVWYKRGGPCRLGAVLGGGGGGCKHGRAGSARTGRRGAGGVPTSVWCSGPMGGGGGGVTGTAHLTRDVRGDEQGGMRTSRVGGGNVKPWAVQAGREVVVMFAKGALRMSAELRAMNADSARQKWKFLTIFWCPAANVPLRRAKIFLKSAFVRNCMQEWTSWVSSHIYSSKSLAELSERGSNAETITCAKDQGICTSGRPPAAAGATFLNKPLTSELLGTSVEPTVRTLHECGHANLVDDRQVCRVTLYGQFPVKMTMASPTLPKQRILRCDRLSAEQHVFGLRAGIVGAAPGDVGVEELEGLKAMIPNNVAIATNACLRRAYSHTPRLRPMPRLVRMPIPATRASSQPSPPASCKIAARAAHRPLPPARRPPPAHASRCPPQRLPVLHHGRRSAIVFHHLWPYVQPRVCRRVYAACLERIRQWERSTRKLHKNECYHSGAWPLASAFTDAMDAALTEYDVPEHPSESEESARTTSSKQRRNENPQLYCLDIDGISYSALQMHGPRLLHDIKQEAVDSTTPTILTIYCYVTFKVRGPYNERDLYTRTRTSHPVPGKTGECTHPHLFKDIAWAVLKAEDLLVAFNATQTQFFLDLQITPKKVCGAACDDGNGRDGEHGSPCVVVD
ncbi:hypothetical protein GGX14DRAFT_398357 [Mycena pura]|uniref:Uncharacterized protein n=1 Tax=Mycena pura TaxID=153505 RepID=A0AAD6Y6F9_9AGAR|nr:hypothetical protein GGX14DRAFT_398357 [Mycena pura]